MNQYERSSLNFFQDFAYSNCTSDQLKTLKSYEYFEKNFLKNDKEINDKEMNDKEIITKITENLFISSTMLSFTLHVNRYISYNYHHLSISTYNNHESKDSFKHSSIHLSKTLFSTFTYQSFCHRLSISHFILFVNSQRFYNMHDSNQQIQILSFHLSHAVKISSIYLSKLSSFYLLNYEII